VGYLIKNWIAIFALLVSIWSLLLAHTINVKDREFACDKDLFEQLKNTLKMAFKAIVSTNDNKTPINDRLQWLISARHIERYRELKLKLKTELYQEICQEHEHFWSDQFHKVINRIPGPDFFHYINEEKMIEESIDLRSVAVVYSFATWSFERKDPITDISLKKIIIDYKLYTPINRNFWLYFERMKPDQAKEILEKIES
jgi:hypothetical protein